MLIHTAEELTEYSTSEEKMMEDQIKAIAEGGAKVVVAGGTVSEMALHYVDKVRCCVTISRSVLASHCPGWTNGATNVTD